MKSDPGTIKAFATVRVVGDLLRPEEVTQILGTVPTRAFRKGERYRSGTQGADMVGKTGTWFFATDSVVASRNLDDHVAYLLDMFVRDVDTLSALRNLLQKKRLHAHVSLFWHGRRGAKKPAVQSAARDMFKLLPADVETDFDSDEEPPRKKQGAGKSVSP